MNESSQAIVAVKREVQLSEWQQQVQERQEQGIPVDEWCASLGISKGAYYHRLRKVREYMCQQMGLWKAVTQEKRLNLPSLFPFALRNQEKKPLLKFNLESYRSDSTKAPTRSS